jgi:hypothetical protein
MIFDKSKKPLNEEWAVSLLSDIGKLDTTCNKMKLDLYLIPYAKTK